MKKAPCKECTRRHPVCHDFCDVYKEWKKYREALSKHTAKTNACEADVVRMENIRRTLKEKHR